MKNCVLLAAAVLMSASFAAHADPVTYTLTGTFSGTLDGLPFTDTSGTITFTGDTSGITTPGGGFYTDTDGTSTIALDGIGTAVFLSPDFGAESETDGAGFYDIDNGFGVSIYDPVLGDYALTAPFTDTASFLQSFAADSGTTELTSLGELNIDGGGANATFTASLGASPTPEPSSFFLLCIGLLGFAAVMRKRFA